MSHVGSLSVIVISRNEGKELRRTVENLDDTLPEGGEIVVVDDGSTDGSADLLVQRRGRVKLHRKRSLGVARARNFGARHARGIKLVFADSQGKPDQARAAEADAALLNGHCNNGFRGS